jgi:flagellar biosynthesis/type III secretory pathway M-ring protein FliF/YscJ
MSVAHRFHSDRIGWTPANNLFSLMFALLVALALIVLLMLFFQIVRRETPREAPAGPAQAAMLHAGGSLRAP